jgi:hypothetical protein
MGAIPLERRYAIMMKLAAVASLLLSGPVVAASACSSPQHQSSQPGSTPTVNSGSASATTSAPPGGGAARGPATVPLTMGPAPNGSGANIRPQLQVSVNGGPASKVFVDTGSTDVLLKPQDVNPHAATIADVNQILGPPTGTGQYDFSGGSTYYNKYTASLNFGNGIITKPMTIGVITGETDAQGGTVEPKYWEPIIGVGANINTSNPPDSPPDFPVGPVQELPGDLSQGVLVNERGGYFQFGPNPLTPLASMPGSPYTDGLHVKVAYGGVVTDFQSTNAIVDTGGAGGSLPQNLLPASLSTHPGDYLPTGTIVTVQTDSGTLLYSQPVDADLPAVAMDVESSGCFNTGNYVYSLMPIYISYSPSGGTTIFDKLP